MKIANHLNFNQYEARSMRLENLSANPGSPVEGQIIYRSDAGQKYALVWSGTEWVPVDARKFSAAIPLSALVTDPLARANHTGTQLAATISNFDTQVRTNRLDQMAAPAANVAMASFRITGIADAVGPADVPSLLQVQNIAADSSAGIDAKASVRYGTTANVALTGLGTQAGGDWPGAMTSADRVLVKNQTAGAENGIYTVAAGAWTRSLDMNTSAEYTSQAFTFIEEGTTLASTQWKVSTSGTITVGTTSVTWAQWGGATVYTGTNGVDVTGTVISAAVVAAGGVLKTGGLSVDRTKVPFKFASTIGNNAATSFTVNHALATTDIIVQVYELTGGAAWLVDWAVVDANNVTIGPFATAPTTNQFRVIVIG